MSIIAARRSSICPGCRQPITVGEKLVRDEAGWVHLSCPHDAPARLPNLHVERLDVSKIVEIFERAASKLKYPKIVFNCRDGLVVKLRVNGAKSKRPGHISITDDGRYPDNAWFGSIDPATGEWTVGKDATDAVRCVVTKLAEDPAGFAGLYGVRTGSCCFCSRELTDERSVSVGYGPVCAGNYGLPWGASAASEDEPNDSTDCTACHASTDDGSVAYREHFDRVLCDDCDEQWRENEMDAANQRREDARIGYYDRNGN